MIAIHTRPKGSWRHMRYQLGENRPTRQHAVFCLGEPEGRFSAENRDLPKISLRGNNPRMSCAVNMLQRFTPTMTGHYCARAEGNAGDDVSVRGTRRSDRLRIPRFLERGSFFPGG